MIDLRNYSDLIRQTVKEMNDRDRNWKWSVKSMSKNIARIRWGYLDYLEEQNNCFVLKMDNDTHNTGCGDWLWADLPDGDHIECFLVVEGKPNPKIGAEQTIQSGILAALEEIEHYAHNRY